MTAIRISHIETLVAPTTAVVAVIIPRKDHFLTQIVMIVVVNLP